MLPAPTGVGDDTRGARGCQCEGGGPGEGWGSLQCTKTSILLLPFFLQIGPSVTALGDSTTVMDTSPLGKWVENLEWERFRW